MLQGDHVTVRYGDRTVVQDVSFRLEPGQWLMLVGPNGAGKTTLLKAVMRAVPFEGILRWEGRDLGSFSARDLARRIGMLAQQHAVSYSYSVADVVELGRYAYRGGLFSPGDAEEKSRVEDALEKTGLTSLRGAGMLTLSGGETQRVFLAQVFAQNPRVLLLDEPANHLDLKYQQQIFSLIRSWLREPGRAVLSVVHDLNLALRYGTHALLMDQGKCVSQGRLREVMTPENLRRVYGMDVYAWMRDMLSRWQDPESTYEAETGDPE